MATCKECGKEVVIGDWPFCPHGLVRGADSRPFQPIEVWQSNADPDKYSFPGEANEPVPDGYHKIVISNLREGDRFTSRFNELERRRIDEERHLRHTLDDAGVRDRRSEEDARGWVMRADGSKFHIRGNQRAENLRRAAREWADRRREANRSRERSNPNFHIQVLSFDSGNRNSHSSPETGWRERKP